MKTKTKLLFRDSLFLVHWLFCWTMLVFAIWDWGIFAIGSSIILGSAICIFRPKKYRFGKVRAYIFFTVQASWFVIIQIVRAHKIDVDNFPDFPDWLKLVYLLIFLIIGVVFASKIYQDTKFSV